MTLSVALMYPSQVYYPSFLRDFGSWFMDTCPGIFTVLILGDSNKYVKDIPNSWPLRFLKLSFFNNLFSPSSFNYLFVVTSKTLSLPVRTPLYNYDFVFSIL